MAKDNHSEAAQQCTHIIDYFFKKNGNTFSDRKTKSKNRKKQGLK